MPNIFLVEDDRAIAKNLTLLLRSEGFSVIHAPTREEALTALAGDPFDLALIDISLPDGNGFTVYTEIKAAREIPVIFLTASGDEASVVTGLNMKKEGREIFLSALEYRLLLVFVNNPQSILTRDRLLDELWDAAGEFVNDNTLTVYIKRLREKIEDDPANPRIILTVRGTGYRLGGSHVSE